MERDSIDQPRITPLAVVVSILVAIYILAAIVFVPPTQLREFNFVDERGAITALSAIFLAMGSGFSFATFLFSQGSARTIRCFWLLVFVALGFLVLDELLEFHERFGRLLDRVDLMGLTSAGLIRGWNDIIVILYGVAALPVGMLFLPTIVRYPTFLKLICLSFAFYFLHTAIDSLSEPPTTLSVIVEESAKLYCAALIAIACLAALCVHARARLRSEQ